MEKTIVMSFITLQCIWIVCSVWIPKEKVYYIENKLTLNWDNATKHCQKLGMQLLSVESQEEFQRLKDYIYGTYGRMVFYWIGGRKDGEVFKWLAYNEVIEPSKMIWHKDEPNNAGGNEECVNVEKEFDWNDSDCDTLFPFICELREDDIKDITIGSVRAAEWMKKQKRNKTYLQIYNLKAPVAE